MKKIILSLSLFLLTAFNVISMGFRPLAEKTVGDFSLLSTDGKRVSLADYPNAKGAIVIFTCNHCPFAKLYPERLNEMNRKYLPLGVPVVAISSTDTLMYDEDTYENMVKKARSEHFNFPYLYDGSQSVAKAFAAQKTPHAFVLWKIAGEWTVQYDGAIDDNGAHPEKVQHRYVTHAVDELLSGKAVSIRETKSIGCQIHFRK